MIKRTILTASVLSSLACAAFASAGTQDEAASESAATKERVVFVSKKSPAANRTAENSAQKERVVHRYSRKEEPVSASATDSSSPAKRLTLELFYGSAQKDLIDGFGKVNIGGVRGGVELGDFTFGQDFSVSPFVGLELGGGSREVRYYDGKITGTIAHADFLLGARGRIPLSERLSLTGNVRTGLDCLWGEGEIELYGYGSDSTTDTDFGVLFGLGAGLEFEFTENFGLTFGVDYSFSSTELDLDGIKTDAQSYVMFSVGCVWNF